MLALRLRTKLLLFAVVIALIPIAVAGSAILLPSLYYLFRVFKGRR